MTFSSSLPETAIAQPAPRRAVRLGVALALAAALAAPGALGQVTREQAVDAFTAVSSFVAVTLLIFYGAERLFRFDFGQVMTRARIWQVPFAALLGATPGCGGAIMVVAAFAAGRVSFGAMVATLISTMGDAAFLLIAARPDAALVLIPTQFVAAVLFGWAVDRFLPDDLVPIASGSCANPPAIGSLRLRDIGYALALLPGLVLGVAGVMAVDMTYVLGIPAEVIALAGMGLGLAIWSVSPVVTMTNPGDPPLTRMSEETAFVSVWVIAAFLLYAYLEAFAGLDLGQALSGIAIFLPLIAAAIGFIPGCGPQILVTTLFVNGAIPFSALVANAISNDGDALFPAIAMTPRAALLATALSVIPALIVAYGFHFFAPGLLN